MASLKKAFSEARDNKNIGLVLPVLLASKLHVVVAGLSADGKRFDFAMTKAPVNGENCVTVSENASLVTFEKWSKAEIGGRELLKRLPINTGLMVVYEKGGDYLTSKQIEWFLSVLD